MTRPKSSWDVRVGEVPSPLAGLAEKNPPIVITEEARRKAEKRLAKRTAPYRTSRASCPTCRRPV